jgi:DNA-binding CsgD family transcriptional regulator
MNLIPHGLSASIRPGAIQTYIAQGLTNMEIAQREFISINSVKTYIRAAYRKIGVHSRSQAVSWAIQNGIDPARQSSQDRSRNT